MSVLRKNENSMPILHTIIDKYRSFMDSLKFPPLWINENEMWLILVFLEILEKIEQKFKTSLSTLRVLKPSCSWTEVCGQGTEIRGLGHVTLRSISFSWFS